MLDNTTQKGYNKTMETQYYKTVKAEDKKKRSLLNRFKIVKVPDTKAYVIMDRLKLSTCLLDKRFTKRVFDSPETALGFLHGKGKDIRHVKCS
jgi:hypothetical protein